MRWRCGNYSGPRAAALVVFEEEAIDGGLEVGDRPEDSAFQSPLGQRGEETLDGIDPRT
jgi:hypothetical protein